MPVRYITGNPLIKEVIMEYFDFHDPFLWLKIVTIIISAIGATCSLILAIKKRKVKFDALVDFLEQKMEEAEEHTNYNGAEKLKYVLSEVFKYCVENHIKYNEDKVVEKVEELIEFSKKVNNERKNPVL